MRLSDQISGKLGRLPLDNRIPLQDSPVAANTDVESEATFLFINKRPSIIKIELSWQNKLRD